MTRLPYRPATPDHLGYWRVVQPISPIDIELWYKRSGYTWIRMLIHGIPCEISPDWALRHPGEASVGEMTLPYGSLHKDSFRYSLSVVRQFMWTGVIPPGGETMLNPGADAGTNFANVMIVATEDDCWQQVFWMDIIDYDRPYRAAPAKVKPIKPSLKKRIAKYVTKKERKLK